MAEEASTPCACGCGRLIQQAAGAHRHKRYYEAGCRVAALRQRQHAQHEAEMRQRWACYPAETQQLLARILAEQGAVLADEVAEAISREHSEGQQVMLHLLRPQMEQIEQELATYRRIHDISQREHLRQEWEACGEGVGWRPLLLFNLGAGRNAWLDFFSLSDEARIAEAIVAAQDFHEALQDLVNKRPPPRKKQ